MKIIRTPLDSKIIRSLKAGDELRLTGTIYTARDQAHARLFETLARRKPLPFSLDGAVIYYCGPTQTPPGKIIGSCGPTTSGRMDLFTPALLDAGLKGMIGKGSRSPEVVKFIRKNRAVYFLTYAGCGALLQRYVKKAKRIAYSDLGPEAVRELEVENFPLIVGVDSLGRSIL